MPMRRRVARRRPMVRRKPAFKRRTFKRRIARSKVNHITGNGFPPFVMMKMKYSDFGTGALVSGQQVGVTYQNSIYDPVNTSSSGQSQNGSPYGYTQWSAMYKAYTVYAYKIVSKISSITANANPIAMLLCTGPTAVAYNENQFTLAKYPQKVQRTLSNARPIVIKMYVDVARGVGVAKSKVKLDDAYSSVMGANPTNPCYTQLFIEGADDSDTSTVSHNTQVTYYVKLWNPFYTNIA